MRIFDEDFFKGVIIAVGIMLLMRVLLPPIKVVNATDEKISELEKQVSSLEKRLAEKPDYTTAIVFGVVFGSLILGVSALGIVEWVIDYKRLQKK